MASYEEKKLESIFNKEYLAYQKPVTKWIPHFSPQLGEKENRSREIFPVGGIK
ncbi:MAG: hypothetical protein RBG13Loki_1894 [Promethearchaeota archaeon CR_4]|nr:MAG: hypothetical protein RBG13Loki_1894 [Candidatus Lokiarchaeota archaeon CR_4]